MKRIHVTPFLLIPFLVLCGAVEPATKPAAAIENPQYKAWAKFKVGTTIVARGARTRTVEEGGEKLQLKTTVEIEQTLLQLTPEKAVIDTMTKTNQDGREAPMSLRKVVVPRVVTKDELDEAGKGFDPALLKNATEETVTVPAGQFKAKLVEFEKRQGTANVKVKSWFSFDVPGGTVKQESESGGAKSTLELASIEKK